MRSLVAGSFPSTLLVVRIDRFVLLVPWVLVWAMAAMLMPVFWAAAQDSRSSGRRVLRNWHLIVLLLIMMRGTLIAARGRGHSVYLRWL
ncbi:MAG: hypothetical protein JW889_05640 [Verrucomicrobia bacterium]|nr:hypothetical protein [Verrucomicrobiota bacterium]